MKPLSELWRDQDVEAINKKNSDNKEAERLAHYFWQIEYAKTEEYKAIVAEVAKHESLNTPKRKETVMGILRSGLTSDVNTAVDIALAEENSRAGDAHPKRTR